MVTNMRIVFVIFYNSTKNSIHEIHFLVDVFDKVSWQVEGHRTLGLVKLLPSPIESPYAGTVLQHHDYTDPINLNIEYSHHIGVQIYPKFPHHFLQSATFL